MRPHSRTFNRQATAIRTGPEMVRFDSKALHAALDAQRRARGLTWSQVAAETGVSSGTLARTGAGGRLEVDGMLAMVRWLGVPVETFVRSDAQSKSGRSI